MNDQYNPFVAELTTVSKKFKSNSALKDNTHTELAWYKSFDKDGTHTRLNALQIAIRQAEEALQKLKPVLDKHQVKVQEEKKKARLGFNPMHWMSTKRHIAVRAHEEALRQLSPVLRQRDDLNSGKQRDAREAHTLQEAMDRYRAFDLLQAEDMIRFLEQEQEALEQKFTFLNQRARDAESLLRPTWEQLQECIQKEKILQRDIAVAERMEEELSRASDKKQRFFIHQRSQELFQDDKPGRVCDNLKRASNGLRNNIEKTRKRLEIDTARLTRDVRVLVIDGSNLLNKNNHSQDNGNQFIGLAALDALLPALSAKVENVILFFDHGAPRKLRMTERALCERFGRWAKEVIVTPENCPADDTILAAAHKNPHAYVISRDRYGDYRALYPWIKDRVLAPVIANGIVHLHDLFLEVPLVNASLAAIGGGAIATGGGGVAAGAAVIATAGTTVGGVVGASGAAVVVSKIA